ncbi:MAG: lipoate--protein ligase, partial [Candidatus Bathyarchaeia archaeon]
LFEAVGRAVSGGSSPNTVILNHPESPFVNIGYHQLMEKEIDVEYARERGFDLVRRTMGGGAILDGPWEQDYFVVVHRRSADCPPTIPEFYERFLTPPIHALRRYGLDARRRPPNDILVGSRKISGNGAITLGEANVLAGDILLELPVELMMRIIKAPSEKFRDKLAESMAQWLTSMERELGAPPEREEVKRRLVEGFEELGIWLEPGAVTPEEEGYLEELLQERRREEWIFGKDLGYRRLLSAERSQGTKVRGGVSVREAVHKADKMIRVTVVIMDGRIDGISISGDFFTQPYIGAVSKLEEALIGAPLEEEDLRRRIGEAFKKIGLKTFGAASDDFVAAILKAGGDAL